MRELIPETGEILVVRTMGEERRSFGGFQYPASGPGSAPDWCPSFECGHGLHGLPWGVGDAARYEDTTRAFWAVLRVKTDPDNYRAGVGELVDKCKFHRFEDVSYGERDEVIANVAKYAPADAAVHYVTRSGLDSVVLFGGLRSRLEARDMSTLQGGTYSEIRCGDFCMVLGGFQSRIWANEHCVIRGRDYSHIHTEKCCTISVSYAAKVVCGDHCNVVGESFCQLYAGRNSTLIGYEGAWFKAGRGSQFILREPSHRLEGGSAVMRVDTPEKADRWWHFGSSGWTN